MPAIITRACENCNHQVSELDMRLSPSSTVLCPTCYAGQCFICNTCGSEFWAYEGRTFAGHRICNACDRHNEIWALTPSSVSIATYTDIASKRKYGVEIETAACEDYRDLRGHTLFGAKFDCSVSGMEFVSPIMYGDDGLAEIAKLCDYADEHDWSADDDCGLHIHLDVRDETPLQLRHIAYAYAKSYLAWRGLVSSWRACDCHYCHAPSYSAADIRGRKRKIRPWLGSTDRYNYVNFSALERHGTFEVRLMDGTIDYLEIRNWIIAHARFIDAVKDMSYDAIDGLFDCDAVAQFDSLKGLWNRAGGVPIASFYTQRFRLHSAPRNCEDWS
jgi:hypothetical protein